MEWIVVALGGIVVGTIVGFILFSLLQKKDLKKMAKKELQAAKMRIAMIEEESRERIRAEEEKILEAKEQAQMLLARAKQELQSAQDQKRATNGLLERLHRIEEKKAQAIEEARSVVANVASMTPQEAKEELLRLSEEACKREKAALVRKYEAMAKEEAKQKANYVLSQAVTRYAGDFATERLTTNISLPTDEHKGRIIGKEGRNIKSLEQLLGVDIIIDDTPSVITVSSFSLYRRAVAVKVIEVLLEDGRIHPGRIEEVYEEVVSRFEQEMLKEGKDLLLELGVEDMSEELTMLLGRLKYRASYGQNALGHTIEVAKLAGAIAAELGGDRKLAIRAGLLHDIGKALSLEEGGSHVEIGANLCRQYGEDEVVINAIYAHHGHEEPKSIEAAAVCAADTLSAARPGARREVMERYLKRLEQIESIALEFDEVLQAYAINAGRELRVIVDAMAADDNQIVLLAKEIASQIESKVNYPGEIKVQVIRETRAQSIAS